MHPVLLIKLKTDSDQNNPYLTFWWHAVALPWQRPRYLSWHTMARFPWQAPRHATASLTRDPRHAPRQSESPTARRGKPRVKPHGDSGDDPRGYYHGNSYGKAHDILHGNSHSNSHGNSYGDSHGKGS